MTSLSEAYGSSMMMDMDDSLQSSGHVQPPVYSPEIPPVTAQDMQRQTREAFTQNISPAEYMSSPQAPPPPMGSGANMPKDPYYRAAQTVATSLPANPPPRPQQAPQQAQPQPQVAPAYTMPPSSPSLIDRMMMRRPEVSRLFILSLVVLLAIALDKLIHYYLQEYLTHNILKDSMEMLVRAAYPFGIFLLLWIAKSL